MKTEYLGCRIVVLSYQAEEGRWRPGVTVEAQGGVIVKHLTAPTGVVFETENHPTSTG